MRTRVESTVLGLLEELDGAYLSEILNEPVEVDGVAVIGADHGAIGTIARVQLRAAAGRLPDTMVVKLPPRWGWMRAVWEAFGIYERECRFYEELATNAGIRVPRCYANRWPGHGKPGSPQVTPAWWLGLTFLPRVVGARLMKRGYLLLLEDLGDLHAADHVAGCTLDRARLALEALARLHAAHWNSPRLERLWPSGLLGWPAGYRQREFKRKLGCFRKQFEDLVTPNVSRHLDWLVARGPTLLAEMDARPQTLVHGDYHLDNLFFDGDEVVATDWQACGRGTGAFDVAYFLSGSLSQPASEAEEGGLLSFYHRTLCQAGVTDYAFANLQADYERMLLFNLWYQWSIFPTAAEVERLKLVASEKVAVPMARLLERMDRVPC